MTKHQLTMKTKINPAPKPVRKTRKQLEAELETIIRQIVWWRDGGECVEKEVDGARCGGVIQWGHYTPRRQSAWLKFTLATFCQCRNHNGLHDRGSQTMAYAIANLLGKEWQARHEVERDAHRRGYKIPIWELEERLERYRTLWENRPSVYTTRDLEKMGYYEHHS